MALTDLYYKVYHSEGEAVLESWKTEGDFLHNEEFEKARLFGSCLDAGYTNEQGLFIGLEVVTNNYTQEQIESKEAFASALQCEVTFCHV